MSTRSQNSGEHPQKTVRFQRPPTEEERASLHDFVRHLKDCRRCAEALYALWGASDLCRRGSFAAKQLFRLLEVKGEEVWSRSDHQMVRTAARHRPAVLLLSSTTRLGAQDTRTIDWGSRHQHRVSSLRYPPQHNLTSSLPRTIFVAVPAMRIPVPVRVATSSSDTSRHLYHETVIHVDVPALRIPFILA